MALLCLLPATPSMDLNPARSSSRVKSPENMATGGNSTNWTHWIEAQLMN